MVLIYCPKANGKRHKHSDRVTIYFFDFSEVKNCITHYIKKQTERASCYFKYTWYKKALTYTDHFLSFQPTKRVILSDFINIIVFDNLPINTL